MSRPFALFLAVLFLVSALPVAGHAYETEKVIVLVIDGLRNEEAFDDPTHQYIPHIWNDLRPEGTICTEFYNDFLTAFTTPGHEAIVTGQWHFHPNLLTASAFIDARPDAPTMFEYYRYHTGLPQESCMVVSGKENNYRLDYGMEPAYGPDYKSLMYLADTDDDVFDLLAEKLAEHAPDLVLVNMKDVDEGGHTADWGVYTAAIVQADHLVHRVWTELIQGSDDYRDRTTLIVTSDHGRNAPAVGFQGHGGMSHENRHVMFLALGPDTPAGHTITERRYLIDVAPTAGELLGFPTPFAHGQVITGIFDSDLTVDSRVRAYPKNPRIVAKGGSAYVVWSESAGGDMGNERVYAMYKHPSMPAFSAPVLVSNPDEARWAFYPSLGTDMHGLHVVWLDGRPLDGVNDTWSIYYRMSKDWGATWEDEVLIATSVFESPGAPETLAILGEPELTSTWLDEMVITVRYEFLGGVKELVCFRSLDQGKTWREFQIKEQNPFPVQYNPIALDGYKTAVVWTDMAAVPGMPNYFIWDTFFAISTNAGRTWKNYTPLSGSPAYSDRPSLGWTGSALTAVWADRPLTGEPWQLNLRTSMDKGKNWSNVQPLSTGASAWKPCMVWNSNLGEYDLILNGYENGGPNIYISRSNDLENWTPPAPIMDESSNILRCNPRAAYSEGTLFMVWEELDPVSGDWVIIPHEIGDADVASALATR